MPAPTPSDFIDRVDDANHETGLIRRADVFDQSAGFRTVHVFVRSHDGRLLLQHLAATNKRSSGCWGSSVAGYLHAGEQYSTAASRRMREEIGLRTPLKPVGVLEMQDAGAMKFVELFETVADHATIEDVSIDELRYWSRAELDIKLGDDPDAFTPTFRKLYTFWQERKEKPLDS